MKFLISITLGLAMHITCPARDGTRTVVHLENDWQFINEEVGGAELPGPDTAAWDAVSVPHDGAIKGPFDEEIDKQVVRVVQELV